MGQAGGYYLLVALWLAFLHASWMNSWVSATAHSDQVPVHVIVLSDSTASVDQTNGVGYGPDLRANLWPNQLQAGLEKALTGGSHGTGLLILEANAARFNTDVWNVSGRYSYQPLIGPSQPTLEQGGRVPANGSTVRLDSPGSASLSSQSGDTLWLYWASCPDSSGFTVTVDERFQGRFGAIPSSHCVAERTQVYSGKGGNHTLTIAVPSGHAYIYAAEWTRGTRGVEVDNLAVGGATTIFYAGPEKLAYLHTIPNVGLVIVALGINDFAHDTPVAEYRSNLSAIIREIRRNAPHASVLVVSQYPVLADDERNQLGLLQSSYWGAAEQVARQEHVGYVNMGKAWKSVFAEKAHGLLTPDMVHPSDAGGKQFAADLERLVVAGQLAAPN
jgi:lysophospholipase L1-like esterase